MQYLIAAIRTAVQAVIGWLAVRGINVDPGALELVLIGLATGLVTVIIRGLETRFPWLARIFSLGTSTSGPSYTN